MTYYPVVAHHAQTLDRPPLNHPSILIDENYKEVSLRAAAYVARDDDMRERNGAIAIVLGIHWVLCIIQNCIYRQRRRYCQI